MVVLATVAAAVVFVQRRHSGAQLLNYLAASMLARPSRVSSLESALEVCA